MAYERIAGPKLGADVFRGLGPPQGPKLLPKTVDQYIDRTVTDRAVLIVHGIQKIFARDHRTRAGEKTDENPALAGGQVLFQTVRVGDAVAVGIEFETPERDAGRM